MADRRHVVLWGPPGVGKTSAGRALAGQLGVRFEDLDAEVERAVGKPAAQILRDDGEPAFRQAELRALRAVLERQGPSVIAVGGGALLSPEARSLALRDATVVGLAASPGTLAARLERESGARPLLAAADGAGLREGLERLLASRRPAYRIAHTFVSTEARSPSEVAAHVAARLSAGTIPITIGADCAYAVQIAEGAAPSALAEAAALLDATRVFVVTDATVAALHLEPIRAALPDAIVITLAPGEAHKTPAAVLDIAGALAAGGGDRGSLIVALGGGVITDVAGFAASIFARGVRWIAVPTTVMGMVDAATGGKTGANLGAGKNLIGTFHHPSVVLLDPALSATENARAVRSGLAEAVKSAAIADRELFEWLEANTARLVAREPAALRQAILRSVAIKARVVEADPRESGPRLALNFGHTLGHAFEAATGFTRFSHGEAVALGMVAACRVGEACGRTGASTTARMIRLLGSLGLASEAEDALVGAALAYLSLDKKRLGAEIRFVVLEEIGRAAMIHLTEAQLRAALE